MREYVDDFINFLRKEKHCADIETQLGYFTSELSDFYYRAQAKVFELEEEETNSGETDSSIRERLLRNYLHISNRVSKEAGACQDFERYSLKQFSLYGKERFDQLMELCQEEGMPGSRVQWEEAFYNHMRSRSFNSDTGIVFVGYGDDDIYPTLIPVSIAGCIDGKMRYYINEGKAETISNDNSACVCPFAQSDTMFSLMKGIHPQMFDTVLEKHEATIEAVQKEMLEAMKNAGATEEQVKKASEVDLQPFSKAYSEGLRDYIFDTFVKGIVDAVDSFNIEDMVKMAESLISITNLQRHFSSSEESVGGPVDVAVITKSEGFVWVNHKKWFQQELNPQMIERR